MLTHCSIEYAMLSTLALTYCARLTGGVACVAPR
jgi:hypothetical protein